jgi:hypothetical protein
MVNIFVVDVSNTATTKNPKGTLKCPTNSKPDTSE